MLGSGTTRQPLLGLASRDDVVNRYSSQPDEPGSSTLGGAELPRPLSLRIDVSSVADQEQESRARAEVLAEPEKMKTLAETIGKEKWLPLSWQARLQLMLAFHPPAPSVHSERPPSDRVLSMAEDQQSRPYSLPSEPVASPTPPREPSEGGRSVRSDQLHIKTVDSVQLSEPHDTPVPPANTPKKLKRKSTVKKRLQQDAEEKAVAHRNEVEDGLVHNVPRSVLKHLKMDHDVKYMRMIDSHCSGEKKRSKRVVIMEPEHMTVAHPQTGQQLRQVGLDKLSAIDYQDKEFGRSVVMRFDGEADAAFVQTDRHKVDVSNDELFTTAVKLASGCREKLGLPPRLIEPAMYPMFRDLLASAKTEPEDQEPRRIASRESVELAAWESSLSRNMSANMDTAVTFAHDIPTATRDDPNLTLNTDLGNTLTMPNGGKVSSTTTPNNTLRFTYQNVQPTLPQMHEPVRHSSRSSHASQYEPTQGEEDLLKMLSRQQGQHGAMPPPAEPVQEDVPVAMRSSTASIDFVSLSYEENLRAVLVDAATAAWQARGGVGPPCEQLINDLVMRAKNEKKVRKLLLKAVEVAPLLQKQKEHNMHYAQMPQVQVDLQPPTQPQSPAYAAYAQQDTPRAQQGVREASTEAMKQDLLDKINTYAGNPEDVVELREYLMRHYNNLPPGLSSVSLRCGPSGRIRVTYLGHELTPSNMFVRQTD
eukprot:TRINITY_DN17784_c0_g1_i3.p1 TRINITY_DN17784_c0_g1~~TRINITY_DN17784_c0_g1_i3.p1  ORF type:complete len:703 (+),score=156.70 TRINITY_DN17784_c0_g1_i3:37-2145(+)